MCLYAWQTRQPHTSSDFTIFYNSAQRPPLDMYKRPPGPPRGNMNPPHFQWLLKPLTNLSIPAAAAVWRTLNLIALGGCLWWLARHSDERWSAADLGAVLAWSPMQSTINLNQLTWILWPLLIAAWWCWRRDRWIAGAIAFGVALSFKPFLAVFLIWLVTRRQWRAVFAASGSAVAALGLGIAVYGPGVFRDWLAAVASVEWSFAVMNASVRGMLSRSLTASGSAGVPLVIAPAVVNPLFVVAAIFILVVTIVRTRRVTVDRAWPPLMAVSLLASPLGWLYYIWWILPGVKPSRLLFDSPLLWVPMVCVLWGQPSPWATVTIGSVFFWGLLVAWIRLVGDRIGRVGPEHAGEVMKCDPDAPAIG
jgi:hypothetical protein